jgi:hypothetical protein
MIEISLQRVLVCVLVAAGAGAAVWAGVGRGPDRDSECHAAVSDQFAAPVPGGWDSDTLNDHWDAYRDLIPVPNGASGEALLASLPPELIAMAHEISWTECTNSGLVLFLESTFDYNDDGSLGDDERIIAVLAMRDAVWPDAFADAIDEGAQANDEFSGSTAVIELSPRDRRLYHDVDEARRRDREEAGGTGELDPVVRDQIVGRFGIETDGHLSVTELSRFMARYNAGSAVADLDGDSVINESDLRLFLNVASPIEEKEDVK